jgi:hypothetical protein
VTITHRTAGEPVAAAALPSLLSAGANDMPWPDWVGHAVGLQYCAAKEHVLLDDDFLTWLDTRPDLLLSLAATTYPVQTNVWKNMETLWQEFQSDLDANPDLGSHLIGFAYMQRKNSVTADVVTMQHSTAHGDGDVSGGHTKGHYGNGKVPVHGTTCGEGVPGDFPERDEHPTATEILRFHLKQSKDPSLRDVDPVAYPWPLVSHGYYPPVRECEWVLQNRDAKCPYKMEYFEWINDKGLTPPSSNPFCRNSSWHPLSLPRITEDGRASGGCSYHSFAKASCLGKVAGRRLEPGHSADFILSAEEGTGKGRTFKVSSPWSINAGFKDLNGKIPFPDTLVDTVTEADKEEKWLGNSGTYLDLEKLAEAVGSGNLPRFDTARLAGMLAEHTYWYVDEGTRREVLKPLAQRAVQLSPNNTHLWRLVFKLNSKRKTYAGRSREADQAFKGAVFGSVNFNPAEEVNGYLEADPQPLAQQYKTCFEQKLCDESGKEFWPFRDARTTAQSVTATALVEADAQNFEDMAASQEFSDLFLDFKDELLAVWHNEDPADRETLRQLLDVEGHQYGQVLPVAHVDRDSARRLARGEPLLERCAFRRVAAFVEKNLGREAAGWVATARLKLMNPSPEHVAGKLEDVSEFFTWLDGGMNAAEVPSSPCSDESFEAPASASKECRAWLRMVAKQHTCNKDGLPVEDEGDHDEYDGMRNKEGIPEEDEEEDEEDGASVLSEEDEVEDDGDDGTAVEDEGEGTSEEDEEEDDDTSVENELAGMSGEDEEEDDEDEGTYAEEGDDDESTETGESSTTTADTSTTTELNTTISLLVSGRGSMKRGEGASRSG